MLNNELTRETECQKVYMEYHIYCKCWNANLQRNGRNGRYDLIYEKAQLGGRTSKAMKIVVACDQQKKVTQTKT